MAALEERPAPIQPACCAGCIAPSGFARLQAVRLREGFHHSNSRRLESLAAKLVKQLNYILDNERDSTGSGAAHPPTTIASIPTHLQRILTTLLVVQVIEIEWLVNGLQRCEQLRFQERMMRSLPCVCVK